MSVLGGFLVRIISPYLVQMREKTDQKKSEYRHFSRSETGTKWSHFVGLKFNSTHVYLFLPFSHYYWTDAAGMAYVGGLCHSSSNAADAVSLEFLCDI